MILLGKLAGRTALSVGGLLFFFLLERFVPFKPPVDPRFRRWGRNLFLSFANAMIVQGLLGASLVAYGAWLEGNGIGVLNALRVPEWLNIALTIVILDGTTYFWHMAYHEWPPMWRLHRVHHSDRDLDVTSASRFHIGEILLSTVYRMAVIAVVGPSVMAVIYFEMALLFYSQMEHANIRLPPKWDRRLRAVFVTPDMHRVHHDMPREHTNSNYSTIFSFWDRLFGTYVVEGVKQEGIRIGIPEYPDAGDVTLDKLLLMPFVDPPARAPEPGTPRSESASHPKSAPGRSGP